MRTLALARATVTNAKRSVATTGAAILLAGGAAAGLVATAPTASAAPALGDTHCFASTKNGPHVGCQLDRADSKNFRGAFLAAGAAAAGTVCAVFAESGPVDALCVGAAAGIAYWVSTYAPTLGPGQCVEIGLGVDNAPYQLDAGAGYIKRISCSIELATRSRGEARAATARAPSLLFTCDLTWPGSSQGGAEGPG